MAPPKRYLPEEYILLVISFKTFHYVVNSAIAIARTIVMVRSLGGVDAVTRGRCVKWFCEYNKKLSIR